MIALGLVIFFWAGPANTATGCSEDAAVVMAQGSIEITNDGEAVAYDGVVGETALATLCDLTTATTEDSDFGSFVTSIAGVEATDGENFWSFYVNGEFATEGASTYVAKEGDQFEWRLEEIQI